jgi:hypothetical protein
MKPQPTTLPGTRVGVVVTCLLAFAATGCELLAKTTEGTLELRVVGTRADEAVIDDGVVVGAVVTIDSIYLEPPGDGERVVLRDRPFTTSLFDLDEGTELLLETARLPSDDYSQVRFVISGGYLDIAGQGIYATDGYAEVPADREVIGELKMPSFDTSGLKADLPDGFFEAGGETGVVARFDVAETFGHQAGASGGWVMQPHMDVTLAERTGSVELLVDIEAVLDIVVGPVRLDVVDAEGRIEASFDLAADASGRVHEGRLLDVMTGEGPFRFELSAYTSATTVMELITQPEIVTVELAEGQDLRLELSAVGVTTM